MKHWIGVHTDETGGIEMAARRAGAAGMTALQIFTAPPRFYGDRSGIKPDRVERFHATLEETGIPLDHVMVHGAYLLGVATADERKWARAAAGLRKELERSTTLGVRGVCFHPGSAGDGDRRAAAERVARAMTEALEAVEGETQLWVENTAGAGQTFGRTPGELADILSHLPGRLRERAGYGLDTCHLYAAGFDLAESQKRLSEILGEFEEACGGPPAFFHLNDSEGTLGSNKDRHTLIGEGALGVQPFAWLLQDERTHAVPLILETPRERAEVDAEDASADSNDRAMAKLLLSLV